MSSGLPSLLKERALAVISAASRRHAVLLPSEAGREEEILSVDVPYRVDGSTLTLEIREEASGSLTAELLSYTGHFPTRKVWEGLRGVYTGPSELNLDVATGSVTLGGKQWGKVPMPLASRRFCWRLTLAQANGVTRKRLTGHYLPVFGRVVDESYYRGDDYVDHEAQSAGEHQFVLDLIQQHRAQGPVLEIGCATGGLLAALDGIGIHSVGLDVSEWAVTQAALRLGQGRAYLCNVEHDDLPEVIEQTGPFGTLVLWAVLEHFHDPPAVLRRLTAVARRGATLFINTTNSDSLTHTLFGRDWEGHFDWTHHGVGQVNVFRLREWLNDLGWRVQQMDTELIWDTNADPTRATLRDWWIADARFRRLIIERELGDLIRCVAVKE